MKCLIKIVAFSNLYIVLNIYFNDFVQVTPTRFGWPFSYRSVSFFGFVERLLSRLCWPNQVHYGIISRRKFFSHALLLHKTWIIFIYIIIVLICCIGNFLLIFNLPLLIALIFSNIILIDNELFAVFRCTDYRRVGPFTSHLADMSILRIFTVFSYRSNWQITVQITFQISIYNALLILRGIRRKITTMIATIVVIIIILARHHFEARFVNKLLPCFLLLQ